MRFAKYILIQQCFSAALCYAQVAESDTLGLQKKMQVGVLIEGGINFTTLSRYASLVYEKSHPPLYSFPRYWEVNEYSTGSVVVPEDFVCGKGTPFPAIAMGVQLNSIKHKFFSHVIELGYMPLSGEYSYTLSYKKESPPRAYSVWDTVQTIFDQKIISVSYKFQPTYKWLFFSFALSPTLYLNEAVHHKKEMVIYEDYEFQPHVYTKSHYSMDNDSISHFFSIPFQVGLGGSVKRGRVGVKSGFYLTFGKDYNFYCVSLGIVYNLAETLPK